MKLKHLAVCLTIPGCCWMGGEAPPPDRVFEVTYLPYKQPNRDPGYPKMAPLRDEGDGTYFEYNRSSEDYDWGKRYVIEMRSSYNSFTRYTDIQTVRVVSETEDLTSPFRLYGISAPYFGEDRRSFMDGKAFVCEPELCQTLDDAIDGKKKFDLVMAFGATYKDPLKVQSVEPPSCYTVMDCRIREACCADGESPVCKDWESCKTADQIGPVRAEWTPKEAKEEPQ